MKYHKVRSAPMRDFPDDTRLFNLSWTTGGEDGTTMCYRVWFLTTSGNKFRNIKVGDVCPIRYKDVRSTYRLGRVVETKLGDDGLVRSVRLQYKLPNEKTFRYVDRAVQGIAVIVPIEEQ